jgi:hypothetical protein
MFFWVVIGVSFVDGNESACVTGVLTFERSAWRNPLAFVGRRIVFRSFYLREAVGGNGESSRLLICVQWRRLELRWIALSEGWVW